MNKELSKKHRIYTRKGKPTKCSIIRKWLEENPKGTREEYIKITGDEVTHSQFHYAKKYYTTKDESKATTNIVVKRPVRKKTVLEDIKNQDKLLDENIFLRWWVDGERKGFIDRLLAELKKK